MLLLGLLLLRMLLPMVPTLLLLLQKLLGSQ
jgi:hypothetical protein